MTESTAPEEKYLVQFGRVQSPLFARWPLHAMIVVRNEEGLVQNNPFPLFSVDSVEQEMGKIAHVIQASREQVSEIVTAAKALGLPQNRTRFDKIVVSMGTMAAALIDRFTGSLSPQAHAHTRPARLMTYPSSDGHLLVPIEGFTYPPYGMIDLGYFLETNLTPIVFSVMGATDSLMRCYDAGLLDEDEVNRLHGEIFTSTLSVTDALTQADLIARAYPKQPLYWQFVLGAYTPQKPTRFEWAEDGQSVRLFAFDQVLIGERPARSQREARLFLTRAVESGLLNEQSKEDLLAQLHVTELALETPQGGVDAVLH